MVESTGTPAESAGPDDEATPAESVNLVETAVDLTLGLIALGAAGLRAAPDLAGRIPVRAAAVALVASERAQQEYESLLVRGAELRSTLGGLLAGRLLGPPIVEDEPAEVDPFDLILLDDDDLAEDADEFDAPRTPFVVVASVTGEDEGLPLDEFDQLSLGALRAKARQLGIPELEELLVHEREHGRRDGVLSLLETRIAQLQQEQSAG